MNEAAQTAELGVADILAVVYKDQLRFRPGDPHWAGRDRFLLSIGHYAIALYAALAEAGIIPVEELETYGSDDSRLPMSAMISESFTIGLKWRWLKNSMTPTNRSPATTGNAAPARSPAPCAAAARTKLVSTVTSSIHAA